ncbi:hypothetical protein [Rhodoferax antarcticus]|nr:hypothetical protein [Rhodoferax antarcticus]
MNDAIAMNLLHAVVFVDDHCALVVRFGRRHPQDDKSQVPQHVTCQHANDTHSKHAFFGEVCDALDGVTQALISGRQQVLADFGRFVDQHRPHTAKLIAGYERVGHPSQAELVVIARKYFAQYGLRAGNCQLE